MLHNLRTDLTTTQITDITSRTFTCLPTPHNNRLPYDHDRPIHPTRPKTQKRMQSYEHNTQQPFPFTLPHRTAMQCKPHQSHHSAAQRSAAQRTPPCHPTETTHQPTPASSSPPRTTLRPSQTHQEPGRSPARKASQPKNPAPQSRTPPSKRPPPQTAKSPRRTNTLVAPQPLSHSSSAAQVHAAARQPGSSARHGVRGRLCGRAVRSGCLRPRCGGVRPSAGWLDAVFWSQGSWGLDWGNAFWWRGCLGRDWGALGGSIGLSGKGSEGQAGG